MTDNELRQLRSLVPLHTLSEERFTELTADVRIEKVKRGQTLFLQGDTDQQNIYLLDGQLALMTGDRVVEQISAGSNTARFPISHQLPRQYTAQALTVARFVRIDSRRLSDSLASDSTVDYQVNDLRDESANDDWMTQLLHSPVLQQIPAANIQKVLMKVEQLEVGAGEIILRQGEPGDFYYMLNRGKAVVSRDPGDGGPPVELARLAPGSAFGEEALLSNSPRKATITMLTDGVVLRLRKHDFVELIHLPLSTRYDFEAASAKVASGAVWLDLRAVNAFEQDHIPGSLNLPFESLRYQLSSLDREQHYILLSDSDDMSAAAAFLLTEHGFDVSILDGGLAGHDANSPHAALPNPFETAAANSVTGSSEATANEELQGLLQRISALEEERQTFEAEREATVKERDEKRAEAEEQLRQLHEIEQERDELLQQLADMEAREHGWQERLRKAESKGIAERDRAESADQRLEDLEKQVKTLRRDRDLARESHEQETGLLKEELTELKLELEQLRADNEALHARPTPGPDGAQVQAALAEAVAARDSLETELAEALTAVTEAKREADELRRASVELDAEHARTTESLGAADARVAELEQAVSARDGRLEALRAQAEETAQRIAELESKLRARDAVTGEREAQLAQELEQLRGRRSQEVADHEARLQALLAEKAAAEAKLQELAERLEARDAETAELGQALAEAAEARNALERRVSEIESEALRQAEAQQREREDLAGRLHAAEEGRKADTAGLEAQAAEAAELREALSVERARVAELELQQGNDAQIFAEQRGQSEERLLDLSAQLAVAKDAKTQAEAELRAKEATLAELQEALDEARHAADELGNRLTEAEAGLATRQAVVEREAALQADLLSKERALADLGETLASTVAERDEQSARLATLEGIVADLKARLEAAETRTAEQEAELENAKARRSSHEKELERLQAQDTAGRKELEVALDAAQARIASLSEQLAATEEAYRAAEREVAELGRERTTAGDRVTELKAALADAQREAAAHEQASEDARDELERRDEVEQALREELATAARERDDARTELGGLRSDMEQYAERMKAAEATAADILELERELAMVREQAVQEAVNLRGELEEARARLRDSERSGSASDDALTIEALRQEIETVKGALAERQRELAAAEQDRQTIEDELEDAAREIERLRREGGIGLSTLEVDGESGRQAEEAGGVRTTADVATDIDAILEHGLKDARIRPPRRGIDAGKLVGGGRGSSVLFGLLVGLILVVGGLELAMMLSGRGELFTLLFGAVD